MTEAIAAQAEKAERVHEPTNEHRRPDRSRRPPRRGEVWFTLFDGSRGSEIRNSRPAVVVSVDEANRVLNRVVIVPVTSNTGRLYPSDTLIVLEGATSKTVVDQIQVADRRRLIARMDTITNDEMRELDRAMKRHLGLG